eukprot:TRINITY_DN17380_c0_g1_i1.p3 TRINITY_DN17380_c0_g1~~TRINITY_DN17380_c0_g1_i1.p3  ORF type:complete len:146 (-),score=12.85 TRINITY_DN17380_c0_g1_i1:30-467(-)
MGIPIHALDYGNNCLVSTIGYSVWGLFLSYYGLTVCLIAFIIPLFFFALYTYLEDEMRYCCFALFWVMLPAFLLVVFGGHSLGIISLLKLSKNFTFWVLFGNYMMLLISVLVTITVSIITSILFRKRREAAEKHEMRIVPVSTHS